MDQIKEESAQDDSEYNFKCSTVKTHIRFYRFCLIFYYLLFHIHQFICICTHTHPPLECTFRVLDSMKSAQSTIDFPFNQFTHFQHLYLNISVISMYILFKLMSFSFQNTIYTISFLLFPTPSIESNTK